MAEYFARSAIAIATAIAASQAGAVDASFDEGRALFTKGATPPCAICHTLKEAGATGAVGPVLDELRPDAARVAAAVRTGVGAMPSYAASLKESQIQALARYVSRASGGAK